MQGWLDPTSSLSSVCVCEVADGCPPSDPSRQLVEVAEEYRLVPETLYLSVNFIDRFLAHVPVNPTRPEPHASHATRAPHPPTRPDPHSLPPLPTRTRRTNHRTPSALTLGRLSVASACLSPQVNRSKLQLVGVTCMLIASKYEEIHPPAVDEFVYISVRQQRLQPPAFRLAWNRATTRGLRRHHARD